MSQSSFPPPLPMRKRNLTLVGLPRIQPVYAPPRPTVARRVPTAVMIPPPRRTVMGTRVAPLPPLAELYHPQRLADETRRGHVMAWAALFTIYFVLLALVIL